MSKKNSAELNVESLSEYVEISRQFLRSIRLDTDFGREDALHGYVCQGTARSLLENMAKQINETRQRAFTWTGPYGGGKSSLALVMCSLVSESTVLQKHVQKLLDVSHESEIGKAFAKDGNEWLVLPVVGRRESVISAIDQALNKPDLDASFRKPGRPRVVKSAEIIERLVEEAKARTGSGVLLVIDELGKFLENAAQTGEDIYFYQELAEAASRCDGKLIIVGILHQSFEQYASRLGREARNEWAKVQGRYIDIPLVAGTDEVIELVSRAINFKKPYEHGASRNISVSISMAIRRRRPGAPTNIEDGLFRCWPLHPITAALLGPISKRRFGQNERSTFGFLASREPLGFTEFLDSQVASPLSLYSADAYWDYLKANMELSILASQDGHRWSVSADAVERAESRGTKLHVRLVKVIALIEMFKNGSGLAAENEVLFNAIPDTSEQSIKDILKDLKNWSVIIYRKHLDAWGIYSGSDFDVEGAIQKALSEIESASYENVSDLSDLYPVIAKKLYQTTGTMRWFSRSIVSTLNVAQYIEGFEPQSFSCGEFVLVLPTKDISKRKLEQLLIDVSSVVKSCSLIIGLPKNADRISELSSELNAIERVRRTRPELEGDNVARREIEARLNIVRSELEEQLRDAFTLATWYYKSSKLDIDARKGLSNIASFIAEKIYLSTPRISSELINRDQISSNAKSALRDLLHRMLHHEYSENLGYESYPADAGLYYTVLESSGIHRKIGEAWRFAKPIGKEWSSSFDLMWRATDEFFSNSKQPMRLDELYSLWSNPPFGIKTGVMPILALAYLLCNRQHLAMYIDDTFTSELTDANVDEWLQDERRISFRYVEIAGDRKSLLEGLAKALTDRLGQPVSPEPLDSARGLVAIILKMPYWTHRTESVSEMAKKLRVLLLKARDPHKVLFNDLPAQFSNIDGQELVDIIVELVDELAKAYPKMLADVALGVFKSLDHDGDLNYLKQRAKSVQGVTGDFTLEAFATRLAHYDGSSEAIEGLISLAISKAAKECNDREINAALFQLCKWAMEFRTAETLASVRGRSSTRRAIAVVFGTGNGHSVINSFDVSEADAPQITGLVDQFMASFNGNIKREIFLAALAEAGTRIIETDAGEDR